MKRFWWLVLCIPLLMGLRRDVPQEDLGVVFATHYGDGSCTASTLNSAITAIGSTATTLVIPPNARGSDSPCTWNIAANVTAPATLRVLIPRGPQLIIATSITVTACIDAGPYPIKSGAGTLTYPAGCTLPNYPQHFGAVADGATNASDAFNAAITAWNSSAMAGGEVRVPAGSYLLATEVLIPYQAPTTNKGIKLIGYGAGATHLLAGTNNMSIIHWAGNNGLMEGFSLLANGKTGVSALRVTPVDEAQTSTVVNQNYNTFRNLIIDGVAEGIVLGCGPDVGGADSGCWYNRLQDIHIHDSIRGIWLKDGTNASSSGVNRSIFKNIRIGAPGSGQANTGVHIVSGSTNRFENVDCEGISFGTSPHADPTCYVIELAGAASGNNDTNIFIGGQHEGAGMRCFENHNSLTEFHAVQCPANSATDSFDASTQIPLFWVGGGESAQQPVLVQGSSLYTQGNSQLNTTLSGTLQAENNTWQFNRDIVLRGQKRIFDDTTPNTTTPGSSAGRWQNWTMTTSNMTNVTTVSAEEAMVQQVGGWVTFDFRVQFQATVAGNAVTIQLPIDPDDAHYRLNTTSRMWLVWYSNGTNSGAITAQHAGTSSPFSISIPASGSNWDTAATNNLIHGTIQYMAEGY